MAESLTDKLKLSKRDTGDINWGQGANANLDAVDQHAQQATLRPPRALSATLGSGAVGANLSGNATYFYKVTAINAAGETTESKIPAVLEAQVTESAGPVPVILSWETVKGATGYKIYKSTLSGQEKFLASVSGESTAVYTDDGNVATNGGISVPIGNTARTSVSKIVAGTNVTISPADGTGDVTINAAGGGAAGYATVIVAAPTGVAATDTANIQNAINSLPATGGLVVLREGNYVLNASIALPAAKPVEIAGQGLSTKLSADAAFAATFPAYIFVAPAVGNAKQLAFRDFLVQDTTVAETTSGNIRVFKFVATGTQQFDQIEIRDIQTISVDMLVQASGPSGSKITNFQITGCRSLSTGTAWCLIATNVTLNVVQNTLIQGNTIGMQVNSSNALSISGEGFSVIGNRIDQPGGSEAIMSSSGLKRSVIANNNIKALVGNCIRLSSIGAQPSSDVIISGNDIEADPASTAGINLNDFVSNCIVIGNRINNKPITLTGTGGGGNLVIGNVASAVTDTMGGGNKIVDTYVTSIKKTGAADISGAATLTPGSGITLTQAGNDITIAAAASGGGYANVVVAAPSGTAATDTTNIQNAINAVNAAGGGTVVLREGVYLISSTITPKSGVTLRGMGKSTGFNTGISGTGTGGAQYGTVLKGTTGLGSTPMFSDNTGIAHNITFRDLQIDFGFTNGRGTVAGGQSMVLRGAYVTFINVSMLGNATQGNPDVDITPNNINDIGRNKFIGCDFYNGGATTTIAWQLDGNIIGCYFEGTVATFSELLNFFSGSIVGCYFATNVVYNTATVRVAPNNSGPATVNIVGCYFKQFTGTQTDAIRVDNITAGVVSITGNTAHSTAAGQIRVLASGGKRVVVGNCGFNAYSGGDQAGNDGQSAINSGSAAGGDLSGTYPNPTVAKVNGTSVPAAPTAGQVLTATGPTAANWQTPTAAATPGFGTLLGTGADGAATISANTALPATNTMGTTYGVGANVDNVNHSVAVKNYTDLTIDAGQTLSLAPGVAGMIIRCTGTVTINGVIDVTGAAQNGGGTSSPGGPGASVVGGAIPPTSLCPKLGPAAGGTGSAAPGATGGSYAIIGAGGGGGGYGFGGTDTGGVGGTAPGVGVVNYLRYLLARAYANIFLTGSGGGISGAGGGPSAGSGGGFIYIFANQIVIGPTGTIKANGANAPTGATTATGGCGGGGGGGGFILLAYKTSLTNNGAVQANGGNGGSSLSSGSVSTAGPVGGTNTAVNGTPTSGATGQTDSFVGAGGSGSSGVIIGMQI